MMDILDDVRKIRFEVRLSTEQRDRARTRLEAESTHERKNARRSWLIGGGIGLVAVAAACTVVIVGLVSVHPVPPPIVARSAVPTPSVTVRPGPQESSTPTPVVPTVATVTEGAAELASSSAGSVIAGGRYLRIETRSEHLKTITPAGVAQDPFTARPDVTSAWTYFNTSVTYVPADRSGEWVREFLPDIEIGALYGPTAAEDSEKWLQSLGSEYFVDRVSGGLYEGGEGDGPVGEGPIVKYGSDEYFAAMPRDPQQLLAWNRYRMEAGNAPGDSAVFGILVQDLVTNVAPPDLRAAMFRALALLPGVSLDTFDGAIATLSFRSTDYPRVDSVSIDTATGLVVGTAFTLGSGGTVVPDSVPDNRTWTTITAVDTAP